MKTDNLKKYWDEFLAWFIRFRLRYTGRFITRRFYWNNKTKKDMIEKKNNSGLLTSYKSRYLKKHNIRLFLVFIGFLSIMCWYFNVLYTTQIVNYEEYTKEEVRLIRKTEEITMPRGVVRDSTGVLLLSNKEHYDITFNDLYVAYDRDVNDEMLRAINFCIENGKEWTDTLPITLDEPFKFTLNDVTQNNKKRLYTYLGYIPDFRDAIGNYLLTHQSLIDMSEMQTGQEENTSDIEMTFLQRVKSGLKRARRILKTFSFESNPQKVSKVANKSDLYQKFNVELFTTELMLDAKITPEKVLSWLANEFKVDISDESKYSLLDVRKIVGLQYELYMRKLNDYTKYTMLTEVEPEFVQAFESADITGVQVLKRYSRVYNTDKAAHIVGTVGPLFKEDLDNPVYADYPLDAVIGRSGVELGFESYLRETDGKKVSVYTEQDELVDESYQIEPKAGNTVKLTLDLSYQDAVEKILANSVRRMNNEDGNWGRGAGAAVIKVDTGEVLALGSYPTFNILEYNTKYKQLSSDPSAPLLNRATYGLYPPGSTLKPATAFAALESGTIDRWDRIYDGGHWQYPNAKIGLYCWNRYGHGSLNVTQAITKSCNVFFATLGYRMGMNKLNEYYQMLGLGEHTGLEIGDATGNRPYNPEGEDQAPWAAFGQSNQLYTPLQMANYLATIINGGNHHKAHLLKYVIDPVTGEIIVDGNDNTLINKIDISDDTISAIKTGMRNLARGTLAGYFQNCVVSAGAKTGTAQLGNNKENNGVFICFAPYDKPEIAVAIVIERGGSGAALASTAVNIINSYYYRDHTDYESLLKAEEESEEVVATEH